MKKIDTTKMSTKQREMLLKVYESILDDEKRKLADSYYVKAKAWAEKRCHDFAETKIGQKLIKEYRAGNNALLVLEKLGFGLNQRTDRFDDAKSVLVPSYTQKLEKECYVERDVKLAKLASLKNEFALEIICSNLSYDEIINKIKKRIGDLTK